jgi:ABC-type transport system involved in cytochrome c biogenesis permease subunit
MSQENEHHRPVAQLWLLAAAATVGMGIVVLSKIIFLPVLSASSASEASDQKIEVPPYEYSGWHALPVQENGRVKPFASACEEAVRRTTGRAKFEGRDPVAVVLMWMLRKGTGATDADNWEKHHFLWCPDHDLRREIYESLRQPGEELTEEQLHGKYVSPDELRRSESFKKLIDQADEIREGDREKASHLMTPNQRKAEEVAGRLVLFDSISQNNRVQGRRKQQPSPFQFAALDRVPGGAWFALDVLAECRMDLEDNRRSRAAHGKAPANSLPGDQDMDTPAKWREAMKERLARTPQLYIKPEIKTALDEFQKEVKEGKGNETVEALAAELKRRQEQTVQAFRDRHKQERISIKDFVYDPAFSELGQADLHRLYMLVKEKESIAVSALAAELKASLDRRDQETVEDLHRRIPRNTVKYHPDDPEYRMLHLNYLEARFPDLYPESAAWQTFPEQQTTRVLDSYGRLEKAYATGSAAEFDRASEDFFGALRQVSEEVGPYPGTDTIADRVTDILTGAAPAAPGEELLQLETLFDRVQPFQYAWILMLGSLLLFATSLALGSRIFYAAGWLTFTGSLGFQLFGFFTRVTLSGRPPVSNMYETVIWVSFMSSIFALILELIYRRRVIILAGALVATLGLVLADQLPLALDPKISPLLPVLRSNYWLTIHVLTIVSSYAGGTLAWGLGNIALTMLAFGTPRRELLKTLSQFTYRAMQIAVLLLAAGTFLGGWWAADSWGRFWGWDPKEVWALIALVCYVIPLHMRFIGWVKDFGLAVAAVLCYAAIVMSWYGVNFVLGAGLHSYGFGGGGPWWVFWAGLINIEYVLVCSILYLNKTRVPASPPATSMDDWSDEGTPPTVSEVSHG